MPRRKCRLFITSLVDNARSALASRYQRIIFFDFITRLPEGLAVLTELPGLFYHFGDLLNHYGSICFTTFYADSPFAVCRGVGG
jgi:hypothetical protein